MSRELKRAMEHIDCEEINIDGENVMLMVIGKRVGWSYKKWGKSYGDFFDYEGGLAAQREALELIEDQAERTLVEIKNQ